MKLEGIKDSSGMAICQDGILIKRSWIPPERDDENGEIILEGYYEDTDITEDLPMYLYESCVLQEGLTLRDLFKLCDKHKDFLAKLQYRNFFLQYLELGLNVPPAQDPSTKSLSTPENDSTYPGRWAGYILSTTMTIEQEHPHEEYSYLNMGSVSSDGNIDESKKILVDKKEHVTDSMGFYHDFSGYSFPLTQEDLDKLEYPESHALGEVVLYGGLNSCLKENMDLPLKLNDTIRLKEDAGNRWEYYNMNRAFSYKLGEIIHEIFYEISYHGSPEDSEEFSEKLTKTKKKLDEVLKNKS